MQTRTAHSTAWRACCVWMAAASVLALAGCASSTRLDGPAPVESRGAGGAGADGAGGTGSGVDGAGGSASQVARVDLAGGADAAGAAAQAGGRIVYFDYDSYVVRQDGQAIVAANARRLSADPKRRLLAEGHTDERGGREYNLALGQKRADAVVQAMLLLGVKDGQVEAVSFGKERPAETGSGEAVWARNRRVELKDR
ncbi:peptidoglycan-associated lipoprotein [Sphaerotilus hippei]|uniref:Peptidoglycan-associated lipoprotein n=1 Tax=Sphaerotilus hippei TaxID=744406 RepID=A0A318H2B4_9BURK|nr:OmpA family protein [Sphaerotilus hippei]PXW94796.1 peptidoglycan-associated lipoprotein [Sphaerotilus hippei]